jgi:RNA polymerase sigma factor (sigma-70 family)
MRTAPPSTSDAELLGGTRADFATLFDRHAPAIHRYCARRIGPDTVDDVVADTFTIAYEKRGRFDKSYASALPWLYGIATNVLRRHWLADARHRRQLRHDIDLSPDAAEQAVSRVDADALLRALSGEMAKLSRRHREMLHLYAAGLTYADIATALSVPLGTVMSSLHRARKRLRAALLALGIDAATMEELA